MNIEKLNKCNEVNNKIQDIKEDLLSLKNEQIEDCHVSQLSIYNHETEKDTRIDLVSKVSNNLIREFLIKELGKELEKLYKEFESL